MHKSAKLFKDAQCMYIHSHFGSRATSGDARLFFVYAGASMDALFDVVAALDVSDS